VYYENYYINSSNVLLVSRQYKRQVHAVALGLLDVVDGQLSSDGGCHRQFARVEVGVNRLYTRETAVQEDALHAVASSSVFCPEDYPLSVGNDKIGSRMFASAITNGVAHPRHFFTLLRYSSKTNGLLMCHGSPCISGS